ncbi:MAG: lysophospholipid acyltransferase family protein [Myxococcota bacterium]
MLGALSNDDLRRLVPTWLASFINEPWRTTNIARVQTLVDGWTEHDFSELRRVATGDFREPKVYEAVGTCRALSRTYCHDILGDPQVDGVPWLEVALSRGPTLVLCNHLSYTDANAVDALLAWSGATELADRLTVAVGPKVFEAPFRRLASSAMHIIPVPQPAGVSSRENMRDLAQLARQSMEAAHEAMQSGRIGCVFPEGSRSRTRRLQPFQRGIRRWLRLEGLQVVPAALWGTEQVMPVGDDTGFEPHPVRLKFAPPYAVGPDGEPTTVLEKTFAAIASRLPQPLQPTEFRALT